MNRFPPPAKSSSIGGLDVALSGRVTLHDDLPALPFVLGLDPDTEVRRICALSIPHLAEANNRNEPHVVAAIKAKAFDQIMEILLNDED